MKLAVFSDLHANRHATEAVWAHATQQGCERVVLLGDYVDYGADPAWVLDFVAQRMSEGAIAVRGNHDEAVSQGDGAHLGGHVQASLQWTRENLSASHLAFLASLPLTVHEAPCLFAHANAHDPAHWAYLDGRMEAMRSLHVTQEPFVFCGHMHQPALYHLSPTGKCGEFAPSDGTRIQLSPLRKWLAIPGSVGQPRDGNPAACYAMFDTSDKTLCFHRVPYDHEAAARRIVDAGLPALLAERLLVGR